MRRHGGLWAGFVAVHLWIFWAIQHAPHQPLSDVTHVYLPWVERGITHGQWVGIGSPWVYPIGALVPMVLVAALGLNHYGAEWLAVVTVLDGLACLCLSRSGARGRTAAYWWLVFLAALGPIALGRIDAMTVPLAVVAVLIVDRRPGLAAALLTFAACVKVWPIALLTAVLVGSRSRLRVLVASGSVAALVFGISLILGASLHTLSSFLTVQSGRGLQLESPAALPWLWLKALGSTQVHVVWLSDIRTMNVVGHGTDLLSHLLTPVMIVVFGVACALGIRAVRTNQRSDALLGPLALALTTTLIVTDKVGSPQYETWIAAPIILGLLQQARGGPSFRVAAVLGVLVAALTQLIYPWSYTSLRAAELSSVILITLRDALLVVLLAVSIKQLVQAAAPGPRLASKASSARDRVKDLAESDRI